MSLVVGATGHVDGMITRQLLEQERPVRILTRPNPSYRALVEAGAEPTPGDLKDRASLDAACAGVDTVITTANSAQRGGADVADPQLFAVRPLGRASLVGQAGPPDR